MHAHHQQSTLKKKKCSIIPIISILCVIVSSINIFLIANIFLLEKNTMVGMPNNGAHDIQLQLSTSQYSRGPHQRKRIRTTNNNKKDDSNNFQPLQNISKKQKQSDDKDDVTTSSWTSPHLVNCHELLRNANHKNETGMYMPIHCPIPTLCSQSTTFLMNIHNPLHDSVSHTIFTEGCFECKHLSKLLIILSQYPNSYLVDVGGNIGMWSLVAAAANHVTYTFEPYKENYVRICKSISKNDSFDDRIHLFNVAATTEETTFRIDVPNRNKGGGRVAVIENNENESENQNINNDATKEDEDSIVKGVTIDSLNLPIPNNHPIVLKIDVEGHELQALTGALNFIQHTNIVYAMTELRPNFHTNEETTKMWKRIFDILSNKQHLKPYRIDNDYTVETMLDVKKLYEWKHLKHPHVRFFDVVWRRE